MSLKLELISSGYLVEMLPKSPGGRLNWRGRSTLSLARGKTHCPGNIKFLQGDILDDSYPTPRFFAVVLKETHFPEHPVLAVLVHGMTHRVLWTPIEIGENRIFNKEGHTFSVTRI